MASITNILESDVPTPDPGLWYSDLGRFRPGCAGQGSVRQPYTVRSWNEDTLTRHDRNTTRTTEQQQNLPTKRLSGEHGNSNERQSTAMPSKRHQIPHQPHRLRWRPVDIALGAALAVACGIVFWGFDFVYSTLSPLLGAVLPGLASLLHAFWYFSGPLSILIIRKPGTALYVNLVGSCTEMLFGNSYSFSFVFASAIVQGIFSELPFAVTRYRKFNLPLSLASGALTALEYGLYVLLFKFQGVALMSPRGITHLVCELIGGTLIAGAMSWFLFRAIAKTGALDRFSSGQSVRNAQ